MTLFRPDMHVGRPHKKAGGYRFYTALSGEPIYPQGTYLIKDAKNPDRKIARAADRPYLSRIVKVLNRENVP
jgi:hypothetical protein